MYAPGCQVECSGANCGPGKAHQYYNTQADWQTSCSTPLCGAHPEPELEEPEVQPAVVENASLAAELASSAEDCSQFCCWSPAGDCGECGTDWNNRMYAPGCQVECSGANCGPGKAHQYYNTQADWQTSCSTPLCGAAQ